MRVNTAAVMPFVLLAHVLKMLTIQVHVFNNGIQMTAKSEDIVPERQITLNLYADGRDVSKFARTLATDFVMSIPVYDMYRALRHSLGGVQVADMRGVEEMEKVWIRFYATDEAVATLAAKGTMMTIRASQTETVAALKKGNKTQKDEAKQMLRVRTIEPETFGAPARPGLVLPPLDGAVYDGTSVNMEGTFQRAVLHRIAASAQNRIHRATPRQQAVHLALGSSKHTLKAEGVSARLPTVAVRLGDDARCLVSEHSMKIPATLNRVEEGKLWNFNAGVLRDLTWQSSNLRVLPDEVNLRVLATPTSRTLEGRYRIGRKSFIIFDVPSGL
jgi:hypothetical protein